MSQQSQPQSAAHSSRKAEEKAVPFIKEVQDRGESALASARGIYDETKARAVELGEDALAQVKDVPKFIRKHPMEAMLVGFGAGLLTAFLVRKALN